MSLSADNLSPAELEMAMAIPRYPQLALPLIKYEMVHKLKCTRNERVSLPLLKHKHKPKGMGLAKAGKSTKSAANIGDVADEEDIIYLWNSPRLMILFDGGDINCAVHYIVQSLHDPFAENAVATLLIQECVLNEFIDRLSDRFQEMPAPIANHPIFLRSMEKIKALKATKIVGNAMKDTPNLVTPILVCDFSHNFLGAGPTGVITLHTFRTPKEATEVYLKESVKFSSVCIWNENLASAYEIVARIATVQIFLINCYDADLDPIKTAFITDENMVKVFRGYHYETITFRKMRKLIVFPIGNIWSNPF
ncbi:uncharacterized protein [Drosophila tropicalis]|uniref:uncharacterized protein n=1 Tax=Drosophila tropicalis TaxID=46794 RepID=UPI0035ABEFEA